jgi:hypothetical protein
LNTCIQTFKCKRNILGKKRGRVLTLDLTLLHSKKKKKKRAILKAQKSNGSPDG